MAAIINTTTNEPTTIECIVNGQDIMADMLGNAGFEHDAEYAYLLTADDVEWWTRWAEEEEAKNADSGETGKKTAREILDAWSIEQHRDWYALDRLADDGTMLRIAVGERADIERQATSMMFGGDDAGCFANEPFYRFKLIDPESARLFFAACTSLDAPSYAAQLLTVREVAERTDRTRQSVLQLIQRERLHAEMILGEWRVMGQALWEFKPYAR